MKNFGDDFRGSSSSGLRGKRLTVAAGALADPFPSGHYIGPSGHQCAPNMGRIVREAPSCCGLCRPRRRPTHTYHAKNLVKSCAIGRRALTMAYVDIDAANNCLPKRGSSWSWGNHTQGRSLIDPLSTGNLLLFGYRYRLASIKSLPAAIRRGGFETLRM